MGRRLKKAVLELSGKDSLIVDKNVRDVDLVAAGIVYGAFSNCGHWCSSVNGSFSQERYDEILDLVVGLTQRLRVGPPDNDAVDIGPVANERQFSIVSDIVEDAVANGAQVVCGGRRLGDVGYFYEPTILTGVTSASRLYSENVFGPVVAID